MHCLESRCYSNSTIPELLFSSSPSDPGYASLAGYPSPVVSDAVLQTPLIDHSDHCRTGNFHLRTPASESKANINEFAPNNCRLHGSFHPYPTDLSPVGSCVGLPGFSNFVPLDCGSPMSESDLVRSFSDACIIDAGRPQCDSSPTCALSYLTEDLSHMQAGQCHVDSRANINARFYSYNFPVGHTLNPYFVHAYALGDELGSGSYGFVMTAYHRTKDYEVAVKFIIKERIPEHAWMENDAIGRLPVEVVLLSFIDHENIVKCLDLFDDSLYFYLVRSHSFLAGLAIYCTCLGSRAAWFTVAQNPKTPLEIYPYLVASLPTASGPCVIPTSVSQFIGQPTAK